jgi:pimeloyl-ACP methyl ester carboxylesterase
MKSPCPLRHGAEIFSLGAKIILCLVILALGDCGPALSAVDLRECSAAPSVRLLTLKEIETDRAIIFVHGLGGHPCGTFGRDGQPRSWPELIDSDERPDAINAVLPLSRFSLYSIDYRTVFDAENTVDEAAKQVEILLTKPLRDGQTILQRYNHVWFVTHSLGGLIVKRLLIRMSDQRLDLTLGRVAGIFLFGVPSNGAHLAKPTAQLARFIGNRFAMVKDLDPGQAAGFLNLTQDAWHSLVERRAGRMFVYCAFEKLAEFGVATVVDNMFAQTRCTKAPQGFGEAHLRLVKPDTTDNPIHLWFRSRIIEAFRDIAASELYTIDPGNKPLGAIIADTLRDGRTMDNATGVQDVGEKISYRDADSKKRADQLGLLRKKYSGPTIADVILKIVDDNNCIFLTIDRSKRQLEMGVSDSLVSCADRGNRITETCADVRCQ